MIDLLFNGVGFPEVALTLNRVTLGVFFMISGGFKLFTKASHANIYGTMVEDHIPFPTFNAWFVAGVEFFAGGALIIGLLTPLAALGLLVVCLVATCTDALRKVKREPVLDWIDDVLYLPEVLYLVMLAIVVMGGAGPYSLDALVWHHLIGG